jgi:hypothetical protein
VHELLESGKGHQGHLTNGHLEAQPGGGVAPSRLVDEAGGRHPPLSTVAALLRPYFFFFLAAFFFAMEEITPSLWWSDYTGGVTGVVTSSFSWPPSSLPSNITSPFAG